MRALSRVCLLFVTAAASIFAQDPLAIFAESPFLPALPLVDWSPDRPGNGPWRNDVVVYQGRAGEGATEVARFPRAGVATIARMKDGRLIAAHQHFPDNDTLNFDTVAIRFSSDEGRTWTHPKVMQLTGLPEGYRFPFDPTLVPLPDGRVRMYFTSLRGRRFEEHRPAIHSAISNNGLEYVYEPGVRFEIEGRPVIDCAVALHRGTFHLFAPDNGTAVIPGAGDDAPDGVGYHATSSDGLHFTRQADVVVEGRRRRWLGNAQSDGNHIIFIGTGAPGVDSGGGGNVWMAASADGSQWKFVPSPAVWGGDPGAVTSGDGKLILVITGEPRRSELPRGR